MIFNKLFGKHVTYDNSHKDPYHTNHADFSKMEHWISKHECHTKPQSRFMTKQ